MQKYGIIWDYVVSILVNMTYFIPALREHCNWVTIPQNLTSGITYPTFS